MDASLYLNPRDVDVLRGFPVHVLAQAYDLAQKSRSQGTRRLIQNAITIDPPGCKDRDDAISVFQNNNSWDLEVSVPDIRAVVGLENPVFHEAVRRVETRYYSFSNDPMFPQVLSEGALSLWRGEERLAITVRARLNNALDVESCVIEPTVLKVAQDFTYQEVGKILNGERSSEFGPMLSEANILAQKLREHRRNRGGIIFEKMSKLRDIVGSINDDGEFICMSQSERSAHELIEELMILTNSLVSQWARDRNIPILYRQHIPEPAPNEILQIVEEQLELIMRKAHYIEDVRYRLAHTLGRAEYGTDFAGHFGLGHGRDKPYTHFTSPIRRLADLLNQMNIMAAHSNEEPPFSHAQMAELGDYANEKIRKIERPPRSKGLGKVMIISKPDLKDQSRPQILDWENTSIKTVIEVMRQVLGSGISEENEHTLIKRLEKEEVLDRTICELIWDSCTNAYGDAKGSLLYSWLIERLTKQPIENMPEWVHNKIAYSGKSVIKEMPAVTCVSKENSRALLEKRKKVLSAMASNLQQGNYVGALQIVHAHHFCHSLRYENFEKTLRSGKDHYSVTCRVKLEEEGNHSLETQGDGRRITFAKQNAARKMLALLCFLES